MLDMPANGAAGPPPAAAASGPRGAAAARAYGLSRESLSDFISAIRQRRRVLIAVIVLIPLCAWVTLQRITPLYTATGSLIYEPSSYKLRELESILRADPTTEGMMASQA